MNRSFIVAVLTVTMIIMMSAAGYAAFDAPHAFLCDNCHGKFSGGADRVASATNSCLTCHSSQGEATRMPVNPDAMSNPFGTASNQPATGSKSSHNWAATAPYAPAAMVQESTLPTGTYITGTPGMTGTVTCIRCHDAKSAAYKPFLRAANTNDALCLNCHAPRITPSGTAVTGSHPIAYRAYSTVYKLNTTAFRRTPLSPNPNNPTAKLGNYLSSGKVVCTTCHATHYADSSSATLDNRSTANGFAVDDPAKGLKGSLQNSKGQLLRTDPIGSSASAINICSSCHKETKNLNHNKNGQNVQCDHCHAAHVDYTGDGSSPNQYLVRRDFSNISISSGKLAAGKKAIYNTATSLRFMRNDGKGICQVCHTPPPGVTIHTQLDTRKGDCLGCHKHSDGFSFAGCDSCHGQPPVQGKAAPGYTALDEAFTPHATHADKAYYNYGCKNCHYDGTRKDSHNTSPASYQSVFIDTAGSVGALAGFPNIQANYDKANKTCANVYCHSNGNPRNGTMTFQPNPFSWANGKGKILGTSTECSTCHDSTTLNTNAHYVHVTTANIKCYVCHDATVTSAGAIKDRDKHANGSKDVIFVNQPLNYVGGVFTASFDPAPGSATCTNSCHTNGAGANPPTLPKWTDAVTGSCDKCHAATPTTTLHPLHFSGTIGPKLGPSPDCTSCHDNSNGKHANGVINLKSGNSCDPCHPAINGTPVWAATAIVTCESCHTGTASRILSHTVTYTAPLKGLNGHSQYSSATVYNVKCTSCHNAAADHIGAAPTEKRLIVTGNALCTTCHINAKMGLMTTARANLLTHGGLSPLNSFAKYTAANRTTAVATRSQDCAGCHDTHGTTNLHSIRTTINGRPIAFKSLTSFYVPTKTNNFYNGLCQACHTKTKYYRNYTSPAVHNPNRNCLDCHQHKGHGFAFAPAGGGCGGCHGYPPVAGAITRAPGTIGTHGNYSSAKAEDYVGGGGAHTVAGHILKNTVAKDGEANYATISCNNCHYNTFATGTHAQGSSPVQTNVNVVVDPKFKFNNTSTIRYNANKCSNVSCHFKASPNWVTGL